MDGALMIVNLLDINGNTIGTLDIPDGSSQDFINAQLAIYSYVVPAPVVLTEQQIIQNDIVNAQAFGDQLLLNYGTQNVILGISTQPAMSVAVSTYLGNLLNLLSGGSLLGAVDQINTYIADTSSTKTALSPFVTNDVLYNYLNQIQTYLQIPLTANPGQ